MKKIKLVILSAFYEPFMSGAEQAAKEIAERLGNNYDITLITGRFDTALCRIEKRPSFTLVRVGIGNKKIDKFLYPFLANLKIRKIKPDIAHAIMESYAGGALVLTKYFYPKAKRILTLQSGDLDDSKKQRKIQIKFFWKKIHSVPDKIIAISSFLSLRAEKLGVSKSKIRIIPNGVDFFKIPESIEKKQNRVICVARLSWEKGINYLIKAWPRVIKEIPFAKLAIVGEGDKRKEIEKIIKDFNLGNSVELKGNLSHNETLAEIKKSEVFICPSLAEGLGIVFIEAQACGVPVIGTKVGGIPDVIQNNENGILIEPKNSEEISKSIIALLQNRDLRDRLSKKALETVKKYDWKKIVEKIDFLYKEII